MIIILQKLSDSKIYSISRTLRLTQQCTLQRFYRDSGWKVIFNTSRTLVLGFRIVYVKVAR